MMMIAPQRALQIILQFSIVVLLLTFINSYRIGVVFNSRIRNNMVSEFLKENNGSPTESNTNIKLKLLKVTENISKQESDLEMSVLNSNIEQVDYLSDNDFIYFLSSLAESGFTFRQFHNVSSWLKIESRIVKINMFVDLQTTDYQGTGISIFFSMLHSLAALQCFWKKMDSETQLFLENIIYEVLNCFTINEDSNYLLIKLMNALSTIRISYNEFSRDTQEIFKKMLTKYLNTCYQQSYQNFSISSFLYQLQKIGFQTSELDPIQTKIFKKSLLKMISRSKKSNFSKLLNCLSNLGFQWQYVDVNFRDALEKQLQHFLVPLNRDDTSGIYSAKEVSSLFVSFSAIGLTWKDLTSITQIELINIISSTFSTMIPREMSSILRSMGKIGMSWNNDIVLNPNSRRNDDQYLQSNNNQHHHHHYHQQSRPEVVIINSFIDNVAKMTGWDLVGCLFGFGQLGVSYEMLFYNEVVTDAMIIKSKYLTSCSVSELMLSIGQMISHSNNIQSSYANSLENGSMTPSHITATAHMTVINQRLLDFLQKLTIKWIYKMNSHELSNYLLGLILLQKHSPSPEFPIPASDYWMPYFSDDMSHRPSTLPSEIFRKINVGSERKSKNSFMIHSSQPHQQIESHEVLVSVGGAIEDNKLTVTSNDITTVMKSSQSLQRYLHSLSSSDFLFVWSQLGKFGITLKTLLNLPDILSLFQEQISSIAIGTTSTTTTTTLSGGNNSRTSNIRGNSLERSVQLLLEVLSTFTSLQSTWSKLPVDLQDIVLISLSKISEAYSNKVAQRAGLLFPLPPSQLDEDIDRCLWHIGRLQIAETSLSQDQTRDILILCQLRLTDAKSAATVVSAVNVLGNLRRRWEQEFHEFELSFPAFKYLIIARAEDFLETATCRELATFLIGISRIDAFRWYYLPHYLRNSLVESMFNYMFDFKDHQRDHHPGHHQFVDIYALTLCITSIEDMDGLRYFSKRQGDRLMLFLSRYADELDKNILMKIVPRLRSIPTRNRRMLSYLCRRIVGILITNDALTNNELISSEDVTPISPAEFITLLRALCLSHDELPILASLSDDSGRIVLTTRSTIQDSELRQHIITVFGKLMRGLQPSEALLAVQLLANLGIRWEEFSQSRRQSFFQLMIDMQQLLSLDYFTALQENIFDMASATILGEWQNFKDIYLPKTTTGYPSNSDSLKKPITDILGTMNAEEMMVTISAGNEKVAHTTISTTSILSNATYIPYVSAATSTESDMALPSDCWSTLEDLRGIIHKLKSHNLANTLYLCVRSGYDLTQLQVSGVWGLLDERIGESVDSWGHMHSKLSMLFNAVDKLRVKQHQISQYTMLRIMTAITQQLPMMSGRAVSNVLYYIARLKWNIHSLNADLMRRFVTAGKMAFFRTCSTMDGQGEFFNALFAASNLFGLSWSKLNVEECRSLRETVVARGNTMTMKDLLVLITALRTLKLKWDSMPTEFTMVIQEKFIELTGDTKSMSIIDSKSMATLIYNLGALQTHWSKLSSLFRVSLMTLWRERVSLMKLPPKDLHHIVVGLAGMNMEWGVVPESLRTVLLLSLSKLAEDVESLPVYSFIGVLSGLVRMRVEWSTLSMQANVTESIQGILITLFPQLSDNMFLDCVTYLDRLSFPWKDILANTNSDSETTTFSSAYIDRLLKVNIVVGNGEIALTTFKHISQKNPSLFSVKFMNGLLLNVFLYLKSHIFNASSIFSTLKTMELPLPSDWNQSTKQGLLEVVDMVVKEQSTQCKLSTVITLLDCCRRAGVHWSDLSPTTQYSFQKYYDEFSSSSANKSLKSNPISVKKWLPKSHSSSTSIIPTSTAPAPNTNQEGIHLQQKLVEVLASMGLDSKQDQKSSTSTAYKSIIENQKSILYLSSTQHSAVINGSTETHKLLHELYLRLPSMKDSDLLKVLYLIGQRGVPRLMLISSGIVEVLDQRLADNNGDLSPGTLIATITWLSRLKLKTDDLPRCIPILIRYFSTSSSLLHSKTLTVSLHSLYALGVTWKNISVEDRIGLVAGVARAASTCPQELGLLLLALHMIGMPWDFLYERIQNILKLVLSRVFRDINTLCKRNSTVGGGLSTTVLNDTAIRCAYVQENGRKVLKYLGEVEATWDQIGEKATLAILKTLPILNLSGTTETKKHIWQSLQRISQQSVKMAKHDRENDNNDIMGMLNISVAVWEKLEESERTIIHETILQNLV